MANITPIVKHMSFDIAQEIYMHSAFLLVHWNKACAASFSLYSHGPEDQYG
jgi:hypothetical protein